jgi:serine protein kinase
MSDAREKPLFDLVREHRAAQADTGLTWEGSYADYLALVDQRPILARNAWQRLVDMIASHGCEPRRPGLVRRWRIFDDPFSEGEDAVFGLDRALDELVRTFQAGARGLGPERRIVLLHGPVGSAKSTIARLLKRGLEAYSRTDEGALYTFDWLVDGAVTPSPMNQDPLMLIPAEQRGVVEARLNARVRRPDRLRIQGELDPVGRFWLRELMQRHDRNWAKVVEHVRVRRFCFSEVDRVGIGTFQPKDEKNQDSTELTGDLNYRLIAEYGSDSDPRAFNFDGEFHVANRGLLEFVEVLKLDVAFLYDLLGATQEHAIKPKKFQQTHIDQVILGHTNEPEFKKLQNNELMEAFRDRTIKIDVPYNLRVSDEVRIHRRRYGDKSRPGRVLAPHSLYVASLWSVLTRLDEPKLQNLSIVQKAELYDGQEVPGFSQEQVEELRRDAPREGMEGVSPRYVQDRIATCLVADQATVGPKDVLAALEAGLDHHSMVAGEELRKHYRELISKVRERYEEIVKHEVQVAIASDAEGIDRLCAKYLDNVRAYTTREKVLGPDGEPRDPDERLMRAVEEKTDIPESRKDDFRHELMNYIAAVHLEGRTFDYRQNKRLTRALELKMFEDQRDSIQLTTLVSSVVDPDTREKIAVIRDRLCRQFGYDERSADVVLRDVAALFSRGAGDGTKPREEAA